jgi:hypothetical protein
MPTIVDPKPAIKSLEKAGWRCLRELEGHNVYRIVNPDGHERRVQFRGRIQSKNVSDQNIYGIYFDCFDDVDEVVLWAH